MKKRKYIKRDSNTPIQQIAIIFIKFIVKRTNAPIAFLQLLKILFIATASLMATVGFVTVIRVLWSIMSLINRLAPNLST